MKRAVMVKVVAAAGAFLAAVIAPLQPAHAAKSKPASAQDILDFCNAKLMTDAEKKALSLGWSPVDRFTLERIRSLLDPTGIKVQAVKAWQQAGATDGDILAYASGQTESDGSFMSTLKSLAAGPHVCLSMAGGTANALKAALTKSLGSEPEEEHTGGQAHSWHTPSLTATLREIPPVDTRYTVLLSMFYK